MFQHDIIVIGASAGGVEALSKLVCHLPADLPAALLIVQHFPAESTSILPKILNRCHSIPAKHADDGEAIQIGQIYIAPPDHHLIARHGHLHLSRGPHENGHRPAVDVLFRSAAHSYGTRVVGVILSGALDDGTAGLSVIKQLGGLAMVQDPNEALVGGMPRSAIENIKIDYVLKVADIATQLIQLASDPLEEGEVESSHLDDENQIVAQDKATRERGEHPDSPSIMTCPGCGGVLWELQDDNLLRFRCHVGHAYSIDSLLAEQAEDIEKALWSAVRALEEKASLAVRMAHQAHQQHRAMSEQQFLQRAQEAKQNAMLVRQMILQQSQLTEPDETSTLEN